MFEVKTTLYSRDEIILHANFANDLLRMRAAEMANYTTAPLLPGACGTQTGPSVVTDAPAPPTAEETRAEVLQTLTTAQETITQTNVVADQAGSPLDLSQVGVERTFRAFIAAKGAAAARAVLDKYSAPRLGDVKESDLPAFVTDLVTA